MAIQSSVTGAMPGAHRSQPRTLQVKPTYALGSLADALSRRGLSPAQVERAHPAMRQAGAGYGSRTAASRADYARAAAAAASNQLALRRR